MKPIVRITVVLCLLLAGGCTDSSDSITITDTTSEAQ